jgi:hypothetical protein
MIHSVWDSVTEFTKNFDPRAKIKKRLMKCSTLGVDDPILAIAKN